MKKPVALALLASSLLTLPAHAADLSDLENESQAAARFCQALWKLAKNAATERDKGTDEDTLLDRLEDDFDHTQIGPDARRLMRNTVKGAFVQREIPPYRYAREARRACNDSFKLP